MLYGDGDTKFLKARSRLHAWLTRVSRMWLPDVVLDDFLYKLGGTDVREDNNNI